jgi:hypothetical protein
LPERQIGLDARGLPAALHLHMCIRILWKSIMASAEGPASSLRCGARAEAGWEEEQ